MAGVKGRSGGARKNAGGARPGAGRKPKSANAAAATPKPKTRAPAAKPAVGAKSPPAGEVPVTSSKSPLTYLLEVMNDPKADAALRVRAALGAAPYVHGKATDLGKKEARQVAAQGVGSSGRFSTTAAPPRLAAAGGKKV